MASTDHNYGKDIDRPPFWKKTAVIVVDQGTGALSKIKATFSSHNIDLRRIQCHLNPKGSYEFFADFDQEPYSQKSAEEVQGLVSSLESISDSVFLMGEYPEVLDEPTTKISLSEAAPCRVEVPWFPRRVEDLDLFANKVMMYGADLEGGDDEPGFKDPEYRERRRYIAKIAKEYRHGQPVPRIEYTAKEIETWGVVYKQIKRLMPTHACREHRRGLPLIEDNCPGFGPDSIPQLDDISRFIQSVTGWRVRPVQGLLSSRDFLNGLAFRVFHSTQYVRHHSKPMYTPEPDVCHDILGHLPLFTDPAFARFSQEIGMASLGAPDEEIARLGTVYWFTVEFGLCRQDGEIRAYGAGLLSSFGELEYCLTDTPDLEPFDPWTASRTPYPITEFQPKYFVAQSFERAKEQVMAYAQSIDRPFVPRYNPYTESMDILDSKDKLMALAEDIRSDSALLAEAMKKL